MKTCRKCHIDKPASDFAPKRNDCRECRKKQKAEWDLANKEHTAAYKKKYVADNAVAIKRKKAAANKANADAISEYNKTRYYANQEYHRARARKWYEENRDRSIARSIAYLVNRSEKDPAFKLAWKLRQRMATIFGRKGLKKSASISSLLGCSIEYFKDYIEAQFIDGMTLDNYGKVWHLDHIIPLAFFDLENKDELALACHFTNIQPLLASENLSKQDNIILHLEHI